MTPPKAFHRTPPTLATTTAPRMGMMGDVQHSFRLYIAGEALNSAHALANLKALCHRFLAGRHKIEVVDVFCDPARALNDGIFMTPTLLKLAPSPVRKIVGTLSDTTALVQALDLPEPGASASARP